MENNNSSRREEDERAVKASRRCRRIPVTRRDDFLWTATSKRTVNVETEGKMRQKSNPDVVATLHGIVQSINNKLLELNVLLQSELAAVHVLWLSEHWLGEEYIKLISTDVFKLVSNFSRSNSDQVVPVFVLNAMCKLRK